MTQTMPREKNKHNVDADIQQRLQQINRFAKNGVFGGKCSGGACRILEGFTKHFSDLAYRRSRSKPSFLRLPARCAKQ